MAASAMQAAPLQVINQSQSGLVTFSTVSSHNTANYYSRSTSDDIVFVTHMVGEAIIAFTSVLTNGLVLLAMAREPRLRTRTNYFVTSLAVADFLVGVIGIPCAMVAFSNIHKDFLGCLLMNTTIVLLTQISIFGLLGIAMERFCAIQYPFAYQRHCSRKMVISIITVTWLAALLIGLVPLFGWNKKATYNGTCSFAGVIDTYYMVYFIFFGCVLLPLFLIFCIYCYIFHVVRQQVKQIISLHVPIKDCNSISPRRLAFFKEMRAAKAFGVLILFFTICWLPLHIMNTVSFFGGHNCRYCYIAAILLSHANSAFNPMLYAYANVKFKIAIRKMLCNGTSLWDSCDISNSNARLEYPGDLYVMDPQPFRGLCKLSSSSLKTTSSSYSLKNLKYFKGKPLKIKHKRTVS